VSSHSDRRTPDNVYPTGCRRIFGREAILHSYRCTPAATSFRPRTSGLGLLLRVARRQGYR